MSVHPRVAPALASALALALLAACRPPPTPPGSPAPAVPPPSEERVLGPASAPAILSAHLSRVDDPQLDGDDGLLVVFSVELDAAALQPRAFVVSREQTGPVWPRRAILAPASEDDENRTVLLVGDFGEAEHPPTHVAVSGALFAEDGTPLRGLGASVVPFGASPEVVAFQVLPVGPGRCEGAGGLVRTYWSDELRGVEPDDLARVEVFTDEAEPTHPLRFDDHEAAHDEAGQDNVLDLCMAGAGPVRRVRMEPGAFADVTGHQSAAIELRVDDPGA